MYHKLSIEETLSSLDVNPETGLSDKEARLRSSEKAKSSDNSSFFKFARGAFSRPVIYMLAIAAILSALLGGVVEAALIVAVIVINGLFSAECRRRAHRVIASAVNASIIHATVLRNGAKMRLPADELVVGDIITLKPGRVVPADVRLISTERLVVDETALGGSADSRKDAESYLLGKIPAERRDNCAFEGTVVIRGRGDGVVVATGLSTERSRRTTLSDTPEKDSAPTFSKIRRLMTRTNAVVFSVCVVVFVASLIYKTEFFPALLSSVALAAAIIPESIFTAALSALSAAAERLSKAGFSAKNMKSIEALGECDVFITDVPKLGVSATYTNGRIHSPQEEDTVPFIYGLLLCDMALPALSAYAAHKCDEKEVSENFPKIGEFSGEVYTTLHRAGDTTVSYTGGDAEEILYRSELIWDFGKIRTLTDFDREEIGESIRALRAEGNHLTAIGMRSGDDVPCDTGLVFLGFAATGAEGDEAKAPDTEKLSCAGVMTYLLTSADAKRASLGASMLGISAEKMLFGRDVAALPDDELRRALRETFVFAGLSVQDKIRIVNIFKNLGKTVCMQGGEVSDAVALAAADVGISDIRAQDAAKEPCSIISGGEHCADRAIVFGKVARGATERTSEYLLSANLAEALGVLLSVVCGFGFPMTALQILLVNLITDTFPPLALARARSLGRCGKAIYISGAILGVLTPFVYWLSMHFMKSEFISQWITFAYLTAGELLLTVPAALCGRKKNGV
ncbi:MAG: hypothetical protein IKU65_00465 [Oscillospiraceae bacterium]|nr:hypothetical protein [Oscillospiraceae bacterium]